MKYKGILLVLIYSLLFLPIWGLLFFEIENSNKLSICIGFVYTALSSHAILDSAIIKNIKYFYFYFLIGPIIYLITGFFFNGIGIYSLFDPVLWGFIILILSKFVIKQLDFKTLFYIGFVSYFYAYHLNPIYKSGLDDNRLPLEIIEEKNMELEKNLSSYQFENNKGDTVNLKANKKFILIETWNQSCPPCIMAMSDLQPLIDTLGDKVEHYYLYENGAPKLSMSKSKIYNYSHIQNKAKILLDVGNTFFKDSKMESFPCFLLFDNQGNLIDYFKGYNPKHKDYFLNRIKKMIESN